MAVRTTGIFTNPWVIAESFQRFVHVVTGTGAGEVQFDSCAGPLNQHDHFHLNLPTKHSLNVI